MTESTQLQTADNNNATVVKMEPPTPAPSSSSSSSIAATTTAAAINAANSPPAALNASVMEQLLSPHLQQQQQQHLHQQQSHHQHQQQQQQHHHHQQQQQQQQQQQYALKWNDFQTSILSSFRHLRDEEDFVDVTLACDQRSFTAHKVVLSACSPYFRKLLKANPCDHPIVILRDIPSDDVENLLSFMYNGEVNVSHEHLTEFLKTAHLLQIRGLADVSGAAGGVVGGSGGAGGSSYSTAAPSSNINSSKSTLSAALTNPISNKLNFLSGVTQASVSGNGNSNANSTLTAPFTTPAAFAAVASSVAAAAAAAALTSNNSNNSSNNHNSNNNNNNNNGNNNNSLGNSLPSSNTPAIQELKASASASASPSNHHWDLDNDNDSSSNNNNNTNSNNNNNNNVSRSHSHLTPPPQKRIKSADLFRAQHGISPERLLLEREFPVAGQHPLTRERRNRDQSRDRTRDLEIRESLLGQALESSNSQHQQQQQQQVGSYAWNENSSHLTKYLASHQKHHQQQQQQQHQQQQHSGESLHAQSAGEDSNSSDTEPSDRGDVQHDGTMDSLNGSLDNQRQHSFPSAFLGLQGIPGLLPGPSGIGGSDFVSRRSLEMRVRATDPRPCPKCGKIYRSAHTLRTHLEDKHTVCPGYRCVLCGTVAKSRNSLHSHMSRQHRGISTKDLPVLPMPSPFDPELASRLLAKAGVKISAAELRARASPTGGGSGGGGGGSGSGGSGGNGQKLELSNASGGLNDETEDSDDDPEDLTTGSGMYGSGPSVGGAGSDLSRYHESLLSNFGHANTTISRLRNDAVAAAAAAAALGQKDLGGQLPPTTTAAGQSLLDTYLQFITENTFGMAGMSQEHAAAAALHAAKMAQLNAIGHHGLDKLQSGLLPPQFDLAKITGASNFNAASGGVIGGINTPTSVGGGSLTIEPVLRRETTPCSSTSPNENGPTTTLSTSSASTPVGGNSSSAASAAGGDMIMNSRRDASEPMDLGLIDNNQSGSHNDGANSDADDNYSEDEGVHNT